MGIPFSTDMADFFLGDSFANIRLFVQTHRVKYADPLRLQTALRRHFPDIPAHQLSAAQAQCSLQSLAGRLSMPEGVLLHRDALEQASSGIAARRHAALLGGRAHILELCSGIGSDSIRLADRCSQLTCVEQDPVTAAFLDHNLRLAGIKHATVIISDASGIVGHGIAGDVDAVFADPSRRSTGRRRIDVEEYSPPLAELLGIPARIPLIVKIAPAADVADDTWRRVFLAVESGCPEQLLVRGLDLPAVCALDAGTGEYWSPSAFTADGRDLADPKKGGWLIEPHAAIIRTGGVRSYMAEIDAVPLDPLIAYGMAVVQPPQSRWHSVFHVLDVLPYNRKRLRDAVRHARFGMTTEIKKRGFPLLPDEVRRQLDLIGDIPGVIILSRQGDRHIAILAERVRTDG